MAYSEEYDHFHVVSICVECAEISIVALAQDEKALTIFFNEVASDLKRAADDALPFMPKRVEFTTEIVVPNQILKITPKDGHNTGHVVVAVVHKCTDPYQYCFEMQKRESIKKMAESMASSFFEKMNKRPRKNQPADKTDDIARKLLDSLDLPDDMFKGIN